MKHTPNERMSLVKLRSSFANVVTSAYGAFQMTLPSLSNNTREEAGRCSTVPVAIISP